MFVSYNLRPKEEKQTSVILIADNYYNTLFNNNLYTSCKEDMSLIRLLTYFCEDLITECDDGQLVEDYLKDFFNQSAIFFLKSNNLAYEMNISDLTDKEFYFKEGDCTNKFVYALPAQTIPTPTYTGNSIRISLKICKK